MRNEDSKDRRTYEQSYVRSLFNSIAPRYDFLNHLLSAGADVRWRRKAISILSAYRPESVLDVATGTADLAIQAARLPITTIRGIDLSPEMLRIARDKIARLGLNDRISVEEGSAEELRFPDNTFGAAMVAFGIRNFSDLNQGLREMLRVVRPGGPVVILEFSKPRQRVFKRLYEFYFTRVLPRVGGIVSRSPEAYQYLPSTVQTFPEGEELLSILASCGYVRLRQRPVSLGIATITIAEKPQSI